MENAHLVGRRLPAEAEPAARGRFTKKPKATFLRARRMTKWCGGPTVWPMPAPRGRCQVPGPACPRSSHPTVRGSSPTALPPARAAGTRSETCPVFIACPIHPTAGTGEVLSRGKTLWRAGAALAELSRAGGRTGLCGQGEGTKGYSCAAWSSKPGPGCGSVFKPGRFWLLAP